MSNEALIGTDSHLVMEMGEGLFLVMSNEALIGTDSHLVMEMGEGLFLV